MQLRIRTAGEGICVIMALSFSRSIVAFSFPAFHGALRQCGKGTAICGLRRLEFHASPALTMSGNGVGGGPGDKNITVGPEGVNYNDVGAVGNLRLSGKGFQAPATKPGPDVGVNFKVKPQEKLAKEIDQDSAKQKDAGSAYNMENLVEFPCLFQMKVLGYRQGEFVEDILDLIGSTIGGVSTTPVTC